ncbi:FAD-dependent oxidoreductase [Jonesia quinghaiensis]|uniref:FAD-dependent oxidoreductase n=1 Tax=Jonesia quinghaiensis TaxID=262806 RepID=UPI00040EC264|nr:FAD-dependent oxidoreductase [Jonesia quinghaiensis]
MSPQFDVIVIGGGAMGSAAAWQLARRGRSVLVCEQFSAGHTRGSSHGGSRIYRATYAQPEYLALMRDALVEWELLEAESGINLLSRVGLVSHGFPPMDFEGPMRAAGVPLEVLSPSDAAERWPGMRFEGKVLFEHSTAGRVNADLALVALQQEATRHGAQVRHDTKVVDVVHHPGHVEVVTEGETFTAGRVVLATGGWMNSLAPRAAGLAGPLPLDVIEVAPAHFSLAEFLPSGELNPMVEDTWPSFTHDHAPTDPVTGEPSRWPGIVYGLATPGEGIKVGFNAYGRHVTADTRTFTHAPEDEVLHRDYVRQWLPGLNPDSSEFLSCTYTKTPSNDFVLDRCGRVVIASPCSGHGFKFTPTLGGIIADLATEPDDAPGVSAQEMFRLSSHLT